MLLRYVWLAGCLGTMAYGQVPDTAGTLPIQPVDLGVMVVQWLGRNPVPVATSQRPHTSWTLLPQVGYNPSFGAVLGAKASAARQLGTQPGTMLSVANTEVFYGTRNILTAQVRFNAFTGGNRWNIQGHLQLSDFSLLDYGEGTKPHPGYPNGPATLPVAKKDSAFSMAYLYKRVHLRVYHRLGDAWYGGGGLLLDMRSSIRESNATEGRESPHAHQSAAAGFNERRHGANGWIATLQYNTREHPLRSYNGWYADAAIRANSTWLGSTQNAWQGQLDVRKYVSLSRRRPDHVLAFWHYASYLLGGTLPYFEMPATATDTYNRAGRGYTIGRFRGQSFAGFEGEYRFPISRNYLLSGVSFFSMQSAGSGSHPGLWTHWQPAAGAGLRILLNRALRSTLCIDYARGVYGAGGLFFGLNEVF